MITITGNNLDLAGLVSVAHGALIEVEPSVWSRVDAARRALIQLITGQTIYGVNTGVGSLANVPVEQEQFGALQANIVRSGCCGIGPALSRRETRAMMCLRACALASGYSGVRQEVIQILVDCLNRGLHPIIPSFGSVGASGDLIPLSHMALMLLGEGSCEFQGDIVSAGEGLKRAGLAPITLEAKEGLSLVNGTDAMTAVGSLALHEAIILVEIADVIAACTVAALGESREPFDHSIHQLRPHPGQITSAERIRDLLEKSTSTDPSAARSRPQTSYSLRCAPQVHGASRQAVECAIKTVEIEMNSVTDNPVVFADEFRVCSGGNFHGMPLALTFHSAAVGLAALGGVSERRLELLINPAFSQLPAFLTPHPGTCSGLMALQLLAASLASHNRVLATPSCLDTIPGNGGIEDFVPMGMTAARSLRDILVGVRSILAIELLAAMQALDLTGGTGLSPKLQTIHSIVRSVVQPLAADRPLDEDVAKLTELLAAGAILRAAVASDPE